MEAHWGTAGHWVTLLPVFPDAWYSTSFHFKAFGPSSSSFSARVTPHLPLPQPQPLEYIFYSSIPSVVFYSKCGFYSKLLQVCTWIFPASHLTAYLSLSSCFAKKCEGLENIPNTEIWIVDYFSHNPAVFNRPTNLICWVQTSRTQESSSVRGPNLEFHWLFLVKKPLCSGLSALLDHATLGLLINLNSTVMGTPRQGR